MDKIIYTSIDRLLYFIEAKGLSIREFSKAVGISHSLLPKTKSLGTDKLEKIFSTYPELNPIWVLTGRGEMIEKKSQHSDHPNLTTQNDHPKPDFDHPKRPPKTEKKPKYKVTVHGVGMPYDLSNIEPSMMTEPTADYITAEMPSKGPTNAFTGMTDAQIEEMLASGFANRLLEMYETGRAAPAIEVRRYQQEIKDLTMEVAGLRYKVSELTLQITALGSRSKPSKDNDAPNIEPTRTK